MHLSASVILEAYHDESDPQACAIVLQQQMTYDADAASTAVPKVPNGLSTTKHVTGHDDVTLSRLS